MKRRWETWLFAAAAAVALLFSVLGCENFLSVEDTDNDDEKPVVQIWGAFGGTEADLFRESLQDFETEEGIDVIYDEQSTLDGQLPSAAAAGTAPDIAMVPQPGLIRELARGGYTFDMANWLGQSYLDQQYDAKWLELTEVDGEHPGVFYRVMTKSLVWYNLGVFTTEGYTVPDTWQEMLDLTQQMANDGYTPWSIGAESGDSDGWVITDWIEDIMLRLYTTDVYDDWVEGTVNFDSTEVRNAITMMEEIMFTTNYVVGGRQGIVDTNFGDAVAAVAGNPPSALLHRQGSFATGFLPDGGDEFGTTVGVFYLPPMVGTQGKPILGGGDIAVPLHDREEIRTLMRHLSTADSIEEWVRAGGAFSPHEDVQQSWYPPAEQAIADIVDTATAFRFDASDMMPPQVGSGTFWSEMMDYVDPGTTRTLDEALQAIDQSWP